MEAFVKINQLNTYLEIIMINRTDQMFKNLSLNFFSIGVSSTEAVSSLDSIENVVLRENETITVYKTLKVTPNDASLIGAHLSYEDLTVIFF
jgi:vesicle coat complex subunit